MSILTIPILNMGRPSELPIVLSWLISACKNRIIERRKWYSVDCIYNIYKSRSNSYDNNCYKVRSFSQHLITIIERSSFPQLKTRYKRGKGRQFIVVYDNEIDKDIPYIQMSSRSI